MNILGQRIRHERSYEVVIDLVNHTLVDLQDLFPVFFRYIVFVEQLLKCSQVFFAGIGLCELLLDDIVYFTKEVGLMGSELRMLFQEGAVIIKNGLQLLSENPSYPPMVFTLSEYGCIRILGRAVGFQSAL